MSVDAVDAPELDASRYRLQLLGTVVLAVMGFGSLMTIVTVSLGLIADDLGTSPTTLGWIVTGLMLAMAVCTPIMGKLGDIHGHRRMFLGGLVGMVVFTALCGLAWNGPSLITFRVLFGVAGAATLPNGMALMMHAFPVEERAKAMGWFQFAMTGAPTVGLVIGGPLVDVFGWRMIFAIFTVVAMIAFAVGWFVVRPTPRKEAVPIDYLGAATLGCFTLALLLAITRGANTIDQGFSALVTDVQLVVLVAIAVAGLALFIRTERRVSHPMLKLEYFSRRNFSSPLVASALNQFAYMGGFIITPLLLGDIFGYKVGAVALFMAPRPAAFALTSPVGGYAAAHFGERKPMIFGSVAMISSMIAFAVGATGGSVILIVLGLILSGVSAGVASPSYNTLVAGAVDRHDLGIANGMSQTVVYMGIVTGIQTMLVILGDDASTSRFGGTYIFGAVVAGAGLLAALNARPPARERAASQQSGI